MRPLKNETLSIRTSAEVKQLLRLAAEREHRSASSMLEVLIREHADKLGLQARQPGARSQTAPNTDEGRTV